MPDNVNPFVIQPPANEVSSPEPPKLEVGDLDKEKKELLLKDMQAILAEYDGESNIPINHDYWGKRNAYSALLGKSRK